MEPARFSADVMAVQRRYEFDEHQNHVFDDMAQAMATAGMAMLLVGPACVALGLLAAFRGEWVGAAAQVVAGASFAVIGGWTREAAGGFRRIVRTEGMDITHLMQAMISMRKVYALQRVVMLVAVAALALGGLVGALSTHSGGARSPDVMAVAAPIQAEADSAAHLAAMVPLAAQDPPLPAAPAPAPVPAPVAPAAPEIPAAPTAAAPIEPATAPTTAPAPARPLSPKAAAKARAMMKAKARLAARKAAKKSTTTAAKKPQKKPAPQPRRKR